MRYLLDTNVVSALRVRGRNRLVETWAASVPVGDQFVAAFTIAEIERGVIAMERSDALIAAVAESAGMSVVTRNTKHFQPFGVPCLNPWRTAADRD